MLSSLSSPSSSSVGYIIHAQLSFHPHDESGSNEPTKPTNHFAIPAFYRIAGLSDRHLNYKYKWDCAYANEFPVAVEGLDGYKMRTIDKDAIGLRWGHNFA
jgi:hypothetical protein